jgi:hypothetical protein
VAQLGECTLPFEHIGNEIASLKELSCASCLVSRVLCLVSCALSCCIDNVPLYVLHHCKPEMLP